jgi:hypothetical protein
MGCYRVRLVLNDQKLTWLLGGMMHAKPIMPDIEEQKLALEERKFAFSRECEEQKFRTESRLRIWGQLTALIPILAIIVGYFVNERAESGKREAAVRTEARAESRRMVDKQLAEFYYPIALRLEKDGAIWMLSGNLTGQKLKIDNKRFSELIEKKILLENHKEILKIIDSHFDLVKNKNENFDSTEFVKSIKQYQKHVAVYLALRELGLPYNPTDVCSDCKFPNSFPQIVTKRITQLERQRAALLDQ